MGFVGAEIFPRRGRAKWGGYGRKSGSLRSALGFASRFGRDDRVFLILKHLLFGQIELGFKLSKHCAGQSVILRLSLKSQIVACALYLQQPGFGGN